MPTRGNPDSNSFAHRAAFRRALRISSLRRVIVAFGAASAVEAATWLAIGVYAFDRSGAAAVGLIVLLPSGDRRTDRRFDCRQTSAEALGFSFMPMAIRVSDGGVNEERADTTGYLIVEADSVQEVLDLTKGCPVLERGTKITVFEPFAVDP